MITIENTTVSGWKATIRGMRNPMNSWSKSDSGVCDNFYTQEQNCGFCDEGCYEGFYLGENDRNLMMKLAEAGSVDAKYRRMIVVYADITAPLYWWKEFDTYKVGTVANSCSTMHKIHAKEFTLDDFSHEHLIGCPMDPEADGCHITAPEEIGEEYIPKEGWRYPTCPGWILENLINVLNACRDKFLKTKDKRYWWQMIQLLPSSYNQRRTVMMNYEVLANIYPHRKDHKLDEWHDFCDWIKELPHSEIITLGK